MKPGQETTSAGKLQNIQSCERYFYFKSIIKWTDNEPEKPHFALGRLIATEMDEYYANGVYPTDPFAVALAKRWPKTEEDGYVESEVCMSEAATYKGWRDDERRADCAYDTEDFVIEGYTIIGGKDVVYLNQNKIADWKSTKEWKYAKTPEEVHQNIQGNLYVARARDIESFEGGWLGDIEFELRYINKSNGKTRGVKATITEEDSRKFMEHARHLARRQRIISAQPSVANVKMSRGACNNFGGCPYRRDCHAIYQLPEQTNMTSMADKLARLKAKRNGTAEAAAEVVAAASPGEIRAAVASMTPVEKAVLKQRLADEVCPSVAVDAAREEARLEALKAEVLAPAPVIKASDICRETEGLKVIGLSYQEGMTAGELAQITVLQKNAPTIWARIKHLHNAAGITPPDVEPDIQPTDGTPLDKHPSIFSEAVRKSLIAAGMSTVEEVTLQLNNGLDLLPLKHIGAGRIEKIKGFLEDSGAFGYLPQGGDATATVPEKAAPQEPKAPEPRTPVGIYVPPGPVPGEIRIPAIPQDEKERLQNSKWLPVLFVGCGEISTPAVNMMPLIHKMCEVVELRNPEWSNWNGGDFKASILALQAVVKEYRENILECDAWYIPEGNAAGKIVSEMIAPWMRAVFGRC